METAHTHAHGEELSYWPPLIGVGVLLFYLGIVQGPIVLGVGALLALLGVFGWIRDDVRSWPLSPPEYVAGQRKPNEILGTYLFLATEVVLFGTLFALWFNTRNRSPFWPPLGVPELDIPQTTFNTILLLLSGVTMHVAHLAIRRNRRTLFLEALAATILLGAAFLALQVEEYLLLFREGMTFGSSLYATSFFLLTGTHGVHVAFGLFLIVLLLLRGLLGQFSSEKHTAVESFALYWHFVDAVWVVLFAVVYLRWI